MAVVKKQNVILLGADNDTVAYSIKIIGIKYVAGTSASLLNGTASDGDILWENTGTVDVFEKVSIDAKDGVYCNLAGAGAKVFLYVD